MATNSQIEWTNTTWNPITGCTKVSSGCDHCYAERFSERFRGVIGHPFESGFDLTLRPDRLAQPKLWRRPQLIFVNSMSDLFHKDIPVGYIHQVFDSMEQANWHVYQVLTKRSSIMRRFVRQRYSESPVPPHIWLGVSIENSSAMIRLHQLKQTNASVRFVSFEPLIGALGTVNLTDIHWVIAGGESGPRARPVKTEWLRELRDQCKNQHVAFFFKQWGGRTPKAGGNMLDGQIWQEYPVVENYKVQGATLQAAGAPKHNSREPMEVGPWAKEKLDCLSKYLNAYTTILRKQNFKGYFYIDAFAGPGTLRIRRQQTTGSSQQSLIKISDHLAEDAGATEYISGSPNVALDTKYPFTDYVFIEIETNRLHQLQELKHSYKDKIPSRRIHIRKLDCNDYLTKLLKDTKWSSWRGVVFLDPFGMQVPWSTVAEIGKTEAIEVFVNFPVGMAIQRLLPNSGVFTRAQRNKLNQYFGTEEWFDVLYSSEQNLFGKQTQKTQRAGDTLVRWYRKRLKHVFGHVSAAREIQNTRGRPLYYLIFAGHNKTGARIANDILRQGVRVIQ